jgi:hypothetical protein
VRCPERAKGLVHLGARFGMGSTTQLGAQLEAVGRSRAGVKLVRFRLQQVLPQRDGLPRWFLRAIGLVVVVAVLFVGLDAAATHAFAGNSDGATVVLEGAALRHGHLLLSGWELSFDSFWAIDAIVYAVAVGIVGVRGDLLAIGPALVALAVIAVGVAVACRGRRPQVAIVAALIVVGVLGLPNPALAFFFLQGPWHVGTTLWCLLAFIGLRHGRFDLGWVIAVAFLAAGLLGDLSTISIGIIPCVAVGVLTMARNRSLRSGVSTVAAAVAAAVLAIGIRVLTVRVGTFAIAHKIARATASSYPANVKLALRWGAGLFGLGRIPIGPSQALGPYETLPTGGLEDAFHALLLVVVLSAIGFECVALLSGVIRAKPLLEMSASRTLVQDLLLFGTAGSVGLFVVLAPSDDGDLARYVTPAVIFATVLAGSVVGHVFARLHDRRVVNVLLVASLALAAAGVVGYVGGLTRAPAPQRVDALGDFLETHRLTSGVGDYWSSSLVTVVTGGKVAVRPVISNGASHLVRYNRQSDASWYKDVHFTFLVFDLDRPWGNVNATIGVDTFGQPSEKFNVGSYVVLVWPKGFRISSSS